METIKSRLLSSVLLLGITFSGPTITQASQIILVEPVIGSFVESGDALRQAVHGITDASKWKPYVVKVEPGRYDLGHDPLYLPEWVDLEGSGTISTRIFGYGSDDREKGVVNGSVNSEVRHLRIIARTSDYVIAFFSNTGGMLTDVEAIARDGTSCWAVRFGSSTGGWPTVRDSKLTARDCTDYNYAMSSKSGMHVTVFDTEITAFGASNELYNIGLYFENYSMPSRVTDVFIRTGDDTTPGVGVKVGMGSAFTDNPWLEVSDSHIDTKGGIGIYTETRLHLKLRHSNIVDSRIGVQYDGWLGANSNFMTIRDSIVTGTTNTLAATENSIDRIRVGSSQLLGGPISTPGVSVKCAGVYDEDYNFFASTCP